MIAIDDVAGWVPCPFDRFATVVVLHDGRAFRLTGDQLTAVVRGPGADSGNLEAVEPPEGATLRPVRRAA